MGDDCREVMKVVVEVGLGEGGSLRGHLTAAMGNQVKGIVKARISEVTKGRRCWRQECPLFR
jgi:hypothetical protein